MTEFLDPNYAVLAFFFSKKFIFFPAVGFLALLRFIIGPWISRFFALLTVVACAIAIGLTFVGSLPQDIPEVRMALEHPLFPEALRIMNLYDGMAVPLGVSLLFLLSTAFRGARAVWIDFVFLALIFMLLIFWGVTTYVL